MRFIFSISLSLSCTNNTHTHAHLSVGPDLCCKKRGVTRRAYSKSHKRHAVWKAALLLFGAHKVRAFCSELVKFLFFPGFFSYEPKKTQSNLQLNLNTINLSINKRLFTFSRNNILSLFANN